MNSSRFLGLVCLLGVCYFISTPTAQAEERYPLLRGTIAKIDHDNNQITLRVSDKEWQVVLDEKSSLRLDGRAVKLAEFKKGMQVLVRYESSEGENRVVVMRTPFAVKTLSRAIRSVLRGDSTVTYDKRADYRKKLEVALQEVDERSEDLEHRAGNADDEMRKRTAPDLKDLQEKREAVRSRLESLKSVSEEKWEESRSTLQDALDDLQKAYDRARLRIK